MAISTTIKQSVHFDFDHVIEELHHYLPSQTPIKDFIHHNTLHAFQSMNFFDAIFRASKLFGYNVTLHLDEFRALYKQGRIRSDILEAVLKREFTGHDFEQWKDKLLNGKYHTYVVPRVGSVRSLWVNVRKTDLDHKVHPLLFRILSAYLDQGIAQWKFPVTDSGFLDAMRSIDNNAASGFIKSKRARRLLHNKNVSVHDLLKTLIGNEKYFEHYIFDQQFSHHGWSGIVSAIEQAPGTLRDARKISLHDLIVFELILEIDALDTKYGTDWRPLCSENESISHNLFAETPKTELHEVLRLWQLSFEWSYYDTVLKAIELNNPPALYSNKPFQAVFCIDERECSLRRHIENIVPECETLGYPGFFSAEFYFKPSGAKFYEKLCPAPVTPKYLIKENGSPPEHRHEALYSPNSNRLVRGTLFTLAYGIWAGVKIFLNLFRPKMSPAISDASEHMNRNAALTVVNRDPSDMENGLQIGFTVQEMTTRAETMLRGMGLIANFAPLVYIVAHGSSSANNPHHSAHDCGACSGRPGSVNARVMATMLNHPDVRKNLATAGIVIPDSIQFLGGMHDTAADKMEFYDENILNAENKILHKRNIDSFEQALDLNAKERSRRFASINTKQNLKNIRKAIFDRSASLFEPRPELGHGTNTLCVVGRRSLTRGIFLDRRAFLNSYDYTTDPEGKFLAGVMRPLGPVCGGINLEYYFSRIDNLRLGAGTKLPHNVNGLIGVTNSADGDLRPGLPVQMIEVHDPCRLMIIVEHYPDVVLKTIQSDPDMYEWFINDWVHIAVFDPATQSFYYFRNGEFVPYSPITTSIPVMPEFDIFIENARKMSSAAITDATEENLPVYLLK
ncbi:MAG: hypothetical protein RL007_744 [Bacteroidota bacterium]|jgi:uncharacterized protein YbcC (UPF0753/DUF2309 family)